MVIMLVCKVRASRTPPHPTHQPRGPRDNCEFDYCNLAVCIPARLGPTVLRLTHPSVAALAARLSSVRCAA